MFIIVVNEIASKSEPKLNFFVQMLSGNQNIWQSDDFPHDLDLSAIH